MSVEKIAALPQKSPIANAGNHPAGHAGKPVNVLFPDQLQGGSPPTYPSGVHVESLSLPLADAAPSAGTPVALTRVAYHSWISTAAHPAQLVQGKLTTDAIVGHAKALLQRNADERGVTIKRLIQNVRSSERERLPSTNESNASYSFHTQLLVPAEQGDSKLINFYLTRVSRRQWEVVAFRQEDITTGFPYLHPPINAERMIIDPASGHILSCVAMTISKTHFFKATEFFGPADRVVPALLILCIAGGLTLKMSFTPLVIIAILVGAILLISALVAFSD